MTHRRELRPPRNLATLAPIVLLSPRLALWEESLMTPRLAFVLVAALALAPVALYAQDNSHPPG